ncbi:ABC transporter permease [Streptosporangium saharense]|uniref:ABC-type transport system involved in multi-copper enzyme maturation permease subunit n=1 Tax=Streptosporangium saharense TaxID=1706840 RepID=A0A7W7QVU7_9ACTN|nr:ABC transporter permease [Streptosporangium saharense]MBB4920722.1 ABC-type transport system involved in multi-copper enzyme maturation permease subunit [Streptosporangium saharense]
MTSIPFSRLLLVETRKLFDTRSGKILTAVLVVLTVASVVGRGLVAGPRLFTLTGTAGIGFGVLLPVLAILAVTGEWSHRTALTTFTLEPRRARVLAAKFLPPLAVTVLAALCALLVAVPTTAAVSAVRHVPADWEVSPLALLGWVATLVLLTAMGSALGALSLNAPVAIVVCLTNTILWNVVGRLGEVGRFLAEWFDLGATTAPLSTGAMTGGDAVRLATSILLWIALPAVLGTLRVTRAEIG